jgi:hypothetical protein
MVIAHLGSGCSVTAVVEAESVKYDDGAYADRWDRDRDAAGGP